MQESLGLKPDWIIVIGFLSRKNLNISLRISLSKILPQIGGNETELKAFLLPFLLNKENVGLFLITWERTKN